MKVSLLLKIKPRNLFLPRLEELYHSRIVQGENALFSFDSFRSGEFEPILICPDLEFIVTYAFQHHAPYKLDTKDAVLCHALHKPDKTFQRHAPYKQWSSVMPQIHSWDPSLGSYKTFNITLDEISLDGQDINKTTTIVLRP